MTDRRKIAMVHATLFVLDFTLVLLLFAYSLGLAIPFLLAAFAVESFLKWFQKFRRFLPWIQRISGVLLILVGLLLVTGQFTRLAAWLVKLTPESLLRLL